MADKAYQIAFAGDAVEDDFYGDVVELTVEESTAAASVLRLRLTLRLQDDGTWTYLEDDRFAPFTQVSVKVGFTGGAGLAGALGGLLGGGGDDGLEPVFDGYITVINLQIGSAPGSAHLEVTAMDTGVLMSLEEKIASWPDM